MDREIKISIVDGSVLVERANPGDRIEVDQYDSDLTGYFLYRANSSISNVEPKVDVIQVPQKTLAEIIAQPDEWDCL